MRTKIESLSNHDDDGNKNPTNLHNWQWKTIFLHALHVHFSFFWHFVDVLVLSTTWDELFCSCVDDVGIWWQMFNFVFLCSKRWFQINSRTVRRHFSSITTLNNWKMVAEKRSYIFRWRSRFRRRRVCLSSLMPDQAIMIYLTSVIHPLFYKKIPLRLNYKVHNTVEAMRKLHVAMCYKALANSCK